MTDRNRTTPLSTSRDYDASVRLVSWGSVLAGTLVALMVLLLLNLLFIGIGIQSIDPATEQDPLAGLATGSLVVLIVTNVLALFAGGWVAGRLAGTPRALRRFEGMMHGILTWGLLTLISFFLLSTAVGQLVSGVTSAVGTGLSAVAQGAASLAPEAAQAVEEAATEEANVLERIQQEAAQLLQQAGVQEDVQQAAEGAQEEAADLAQNPQQAAQELDQLIDELLTETEDITSAASQQDLVDYLTQNAGLSQEEAQDVVSGFVQTYGEAQQTLQQAQTELTEAAEQAAETVGTAAIWAFVGLLVGAVVAALGGVAGTPRKPVETRAL